MAEEGVKACEEHDDCVVLFVNKEGKTYGIHAYAQEGEVWKPDKAVEAGWDAMESLWSDDSKASKASGMASG